MTTSILLHLIINAFPSFQFIYNILHAFTVLCYSLLNVFLFYFNSIYSLFSSKHSKATYFKYE